MADATAQAADSNTSGVTADSLKATLTAKLEAEHVEIQDLSGTLTVLSPTWLAGERLIIDSCCRRMRPGFQCGDCFPAIR